MEGKKKIRITEGWSPKPECNEGNKKNYIETENGGDFFTVDEAKESITSGIIKEMEC